MDKIVSLSKRRGFIFQGSEIYGGLANTWDYGPFGVELKRNVKQAWWQDNVWRRNDMVGLDAGILMHPDVWKASGHLKSFIDEYVECSSCKRRFKVEELKNPGKCPECAKDIDTGKKRKFNLLLKTFLGPVEDKGAQTYFRPETAQGIFVNFSNILNTTRKKLPFGVAQIGKAFRNEITPRNFTFRTREFEQMEIEYFVAPSEAAKHYKQWIEDRFNWYIDLGIKKENLQKRRHSKDELAHYALDCTDIEYNFPFGWSELEGIANRGDFDLRQHSKHSGKSLSCKDEKMGDMFPFIIEPSGGIDRATLAFLVDAYREEEVRGAQRVVLSLDKRLAPIKVAVLPLLKKKERIVELAKKIATDLGGSFSSAYDDTASIGKLYRRQDEVGTCYCVTVDVESLEDKKVTVRDRDSMKQDRIDVTNLKQYLKDKLD